MPKILKGLEKKNRTLFIRISDAELAIIKQKADKYSNGNIAAWIRYASLLEPKKEDIIENNSSS